MFGKKTSTLLKQTGAEVYIYPQKDVFSAVFVIKGNFLFK